MEKGSETKILCLGSFFWQDLHLGKTNFSHKEFPVGTGVFDSALHMALWVDRH